MNVCRHRAILVLIFGGFWSLFQLIHPHRGHPTRHNIHLNENGGNKNGERPLHASLVVVHGGSLPSVVYMRMYTALEMQPLVPVTVNPVNLVDGVLRTVARIAFCADKVAFTEKVGARERQVLTEGAVLLGPVVSDTRDFEKARSQ